MLTSYGRSVTDLKADAPVDRRRKVLIVDDEPDIVRALELRLKMAGYDVVAATDGADALMTALTEQPDLVLLDIGLPHGDGHFVASRLRSNGRTAHIPILFLSARSAPEDVGSARSSGAVGFITKPYDPEELLRRVFWAFES
jgi:two-component system, OmpR family, KDP operon response regulator KdpE